VPLGVPISFGVAVHGVFSVTVLAVGFLTVNFYELEFNFGHGSGFGWLNITAMPGSVGTAKQAAAQNEREAEDEFGFHNMLAFKKTAIERTPKINPFTTNN